MVDFETHIENIMALEGFQAYNITHFDTYTATIEYWINGTKYSKYFIDIGNDNWIEVT